MGQSPEPTEGTYMGIRRTHLSREAAVALVFMLALTLAGCGGDDTDETPSQPPATDAPSPLADIVYTNPKPPFTVSYPGTWLQMGRPTPNQPIAAGSATGENMNVSLEKLPKPEPTLEEYSSSAQAQLQALDLSIDDTGEATLGGEPAAFIQTTGSGGQKVTLWQVFSLKNGYAYVLTYGAPPEAFDEASAQQIADSFSFSG